MRRRRRTYSLGCNLKRRAPPQPPPPPRHVVRGQEKFNKLQTSYSFADFRRSSRFEFELVAALNAKRSERTAKAALSDQDKLRFAFGLAVSISVSVSAAAQFRRRRSSNCKLLRRTTGFFVAFPLAAAKTSQRPASCICASRCDKHHNAAAKFAGLTGLCGFCGGGGGGF